jgi:hypothetical protein
MTVFAAASPASPATTANDVRRRSASRVVIAISSPRSYASSVVAGVRKRRATILRGQDMVRRDHRRVWKRRPGAGEIVDKERSDDA